MKIIDYDKVEEGTFLVTTMDEKGNIYKGEVRIYE